MKSRLIKNIFKQILAIWVSLLITFNPVVLPLIHAEGEATPSATLETGNASSTSTTQTEANTSQNQIPGTVTPGSCGPEITTTCPGPGITNENSANTTSTNDSSAQTGTNQSEGSPGDVNLSTGEATASADTSNQINTNIIEIATPSASLSEPEATPSPFLISNTNEANVNNSQDVDAGTGQNAVTKAAGDVSLQTGDALALGNVFNLLNTNIVGSNFEILILNLTGQNGDINLHEIWLEILNSQPQDSLYLASETTPNNLQIVVANENEANLENDINVTAISGQNQADENGGRAIMDTGDAKALANVTNVVNTNFYGSKFLFTIINIVGNFSGNLILPRQDYFLPSVGGPQPAAASTQTQNTVTSEDNVLTQALSGKNQLNDNTLGSSLKTGNATATSHSFSFLNQTIQGNNWFFMFFNNLGKQNSKILSWADPKSEEELGEQTVLEYSQDTAETETDQISPTQTTIQNNATIKNNINVKAISGQNRADGNSFAQVTTGESLALANLFNLVNLNVLGSQWLFGSVNILGDWDGDTIFAYPDATVAISGPGGEFKPGDELSYGISLENKGYDDAKHVRLTLDLPKGLIYISNTLGSAPQISGRTLIWDLDNLPAKSANNFQIIFKIDPDLSPQDFLTFLDKLITRAYALEEGQREKITVQATVSTSDPQTDTGNDSSSAQTTVLFDPDNSSSDPTDNDDQTEPVLKMTAKNNTGEFIYPGDTILFELEVKNTRSVRATNVKISQDVYDGTPESLGTDEFIVGNMDPGKSTKISFGVQLTEDMPAHLYTTRAKAEADKPGGGIITSNKAVTTFEVRVNGGQFSLPISLK